MKQWISSSTKHDIVPRVNNLCCFCVKNPQNVLHYGIGKIVCFVGCGDDGGRLEQKLFLLREQGQIYDAVVNEKATKQEYHLSGTHFSTYFCGALHSNDVKSPKIDFLTTMRAHKCESFIFYVYCENARTVLFLWYKYTTPYVTGFVRVSD